MIYLYIAAVGVAGALCRYLVGSRIAWDGSGAGTIPSARANRTASAKHSDWVYARASTSPVWTRCDTSGAMPWYRRPPEWMGGGTNPLL